MIELFHYLLNPNGYLFLGSSETSEAAELFLTKDKQSGLYIKRNVPAPEQCLPVFPVRRHGTHAQQQNPARETKLNQLSSDL